MKRVTDLKGQYFCKWTLRYQSTALVELFTFLQMFTDYITDAFSTKESLKIDFGSAFEDESTLFLTFFLVFFL